MVLTCTVLFLVSFIFGVASKFLWKSAWSKKYDVAFTSDVGTKYKDIAYGNKESNTFDIYVPKDHTKEKYGLVVYMHAGGFTAGDKSEDHNMLSWLCSKGYVAAGINYTLRNEKNPEANVYTQSMEIQQGIPMVIKEAEKYGYTIDKMAIGGGSAGHALAMIYAYRDVKISPVPVKLLFGAVGPSSFYAQDWDIYGFDKNTKESNEGAAALFSVMSGETITADMIEDGSYIEKIKPISAVMHVDKNSVASVVAYGQYDKVQPFKGAQRLLQAFQQYTIDYRFFICPHSGHGLQNDNAIYKEYMESVEAYLQKYLPV